MLEILTGVTGPAAALAPESRLPLQAGDAGFDADSADSPAGSDTADSPVQGDPLQTWLEARSGLTARLAPPEPAAPQAGTGTIPAGSAPVPRPADTATPAPERTTEEPPAPEPRMRQVADEVPDDAPSAAPEAAGPALPPAVSSGRAAAAAEEPRPARIAATAPIVQAPVAEPGSAIPDRTLPAAPSAPAVAPAAAPTHPAPPFSASAPLSADAAAQPLPAPVRLLAVDAAQGAAVPATALGLAEAPAQARQMPERPAAALGTALPPDALPAADPLPVAADGIRPLATLPAVAESGPRPPGGPASARAEPREIEPIGRVSARPSPATEPAASFRGAVAGSFASEDASGRAAAPTAASTYAQAVAAGGGALGDALAALQGPAHVGTSPDAAPLRGQPAAPMRQIVEAVLTSRGETTEIALSPEELGRVRMAVTGLDRPQLVIWAERPETLELLRRHADMLTADLSEAGFGSASLEFRDQGGWSAGAPEREAADDDAPAPARASAVAAAPAGRMAAGSERHIDIRL